MFVKVVHIDETLRIMIVFICGTINVLLAKLSMLQKAIYYSYLQQIICTCLQ